MALVTARDFQLTPDVLGAVSGGIKTAGQFQQLQGVAQARDLSAQTKQLTGIVLDQSLPAAQRAQAQQELTALNPQAAQQLQTTQRGETKRFSERETSILQSVTRAADQAKSLPTDEARLDFFKRRKAELENNNIPTDDTQEFIDRFESGDIEGANAFIDRTIELGRREGFIQADAGTGIDAAKAAAKEKEGQQKQVNVLRKSIGDITKTFKTTEEATKRIRSVGKKGTAASDMAVVFSFMKILDPGSTVREGEFATAQNAAGIPERVVNAYNNAKAGTILGDDQRQDFLSQAESLFESQRASTDNQIENLLQQGDQDQIERKRIFGEDRLAEFEKRQQERQPAPQALPQGVTEDDITETMRANNMTREQVMQKLGGQ